MSEKSTKEQIIKNLWSASVWPFKDMRKLAESANAFETDKWAIDAILEKEIMTHRVIDPCCGRGVLSDAAAALGHDVIATDLYNWGYGNIGHDFLAADYEFNDDINNATIYMKQFPHIFDPDTIKQAKNNREKYDAYLDSQNT